LETIGNNFDTNGGLKLLIEYVDKFMKIYLTDETAKQILDEIKASRKGKTDFKISLS
jgi:hypothetical protein